jgi:hypothetical protein
MFEKSFVDNIDWGVLGLVAILVSYCLLGAAYTVPWSLIIKRRGALKVFNFLWVTRLCLQLTGALLALSLVLRLQLLWGKSSVLPHQTYRPGALCRLYLAVGLGVCEPVFLLLALFSCLYSLQITDNKRDPNTIMVYALGFTVPTCAAQVFAAMFTRIVDDLDYAASVHSRFFPPYQIGNAKQCGGLQYAGCKICVFPVFSTLVSCGFAVLLLFSLWHVTKRIARAAINNILRARIMLLQRIVTVVYLASIACRGCTILFKPHTLGFELLRVGYIVAVSVLIASVNFLLVLLPVRDAHIAESCLSLDSFVERPTELMPLVADGARNNSMQEASDA